MEGGEILDSLARVKNYHSRNRHALTPPITYGVLARAAGCLHGAASPRPETGLGVLSACLRLASV